MRNHSQGQMETPELYIVQSLLGTQPDPCPSSLEPLRWLPPIYGDSQPGHHGAHFTPWHCCSTCNACHHALSKRGFPPQLTKGPPGAGMLQSCISPSGLPHRECHLLPHLPRLSHSKLLLPPLLSCWFSLRSLLPESTHWSGRPQGVTSTGSVPSLTHCVNIAFYGFNPPSEEQEDGPLQ